MAEDPVWDELWAGLKESFDVLVDQLRASNSRLGSLAGHHQTTAFPLTAYVSLCRTAPSSQEDLVLTWSIAWRGDRLASTVDIARGDGTIIVEAAPAELRGAGAARRADRRTEARNRVLSG
jgi:hypothetical protein